MLPASVTPCRSVIVASVRCAAQALLKCCPTWYAVVPGDSKFRPGTPWPTAAGPRTTHARVLCRGCAASTDAPVIGAPAARTRSSLARPSSPPSRSSPHRRARRRHRHGAPSSISLTIERAFRQRRPTHPTSSCEPGVCRFRRTPPKVPSPGSAELSAFPQPPFRQTGPSLTRAQRFTSTSAGSRSSSRRSAAHRPASKSQAQRRATPSRPRPTRSMTAAPHRSSSRSPTTYSRARCSQGQRRSQSGSASTASNLPRCISITGNSTPQSPLPTRSQWRSATPPTPGSTCS